MEVKKTKIPKRKPAKKKIKTHTKSEKDDLCAKIFLIISEKGKSIRDILGGKRPRGFPSRSQFHIWLAEDQDRQDQYSRACEDRADYIFEQTLDIADDGTNDFYIDEKGKERVDAENIQRSTLRVRTRQWFLAKVNPKKYGEKVEHSGSADSPLVVTWAKE